MQSEPLVTVVMCVYNAGHFLRPAVQSVLSQSYRNIELLLVDDGSTDCGMEASSDLLAERRVRVLRQDNRGRPAALNRALDEARGEFYAIQDADDLSAPQRIERLVQAMRSNPEAAGAFSGHELIFGGKHVAPQFVQRDSRECQKCIERFAMPAHDPTAMFRLSMVREVRYDTTLPIAHAVDYILQIGERLPLVVVGECLYSYRIHSVSITKKDPAKRLHDVERVLRKACLRRGVDPEKKIDEWRGLQAELGRHQRADNNLAAEFIESSLIQRKTGYRLAAVRTGLQCSCLHPLDLHYHKALIYSLVPGWLIVRLRRN